MRFVLEGNLYFLSASLLFSVPRGSYVWMWMLWRFPCERQAAGEAAHQQRQSVRLSVPLTPPGLSISALSFFVKTALFAILQSLWLKRNKQGQPWNEHVHKLFIVCLLSVVNECVLSWPHGPGFSHGPASSGAYLTFVRSRYAPESVNRIMCCFYLFYWNFFKFVAVEIEY